MNTTTTTTTPYSPKMLPLKLTPYFSPTLLYINIASLSLLAYLRPPGYSSSALSRPPLGPPLGPPLCPAPFFFFLFFFFLPLGCSSGDTETGSHPKALSATSVSPARSCVRPSLVVLLSSQQNAYPDLTGAVAAANDRVSWLMCCKAVSCAWR